jgi:hypothetical protein
VTLPAGRNWRFKAMIAETCRPVLLPRPIGFRRLAKYPINCSTAAKLYRRAPGGSCAPDQQAAGSIMPAIAGRLSDADRRAVADYLATLPPSPATSSKDAR